MMTNKPSLLMFLGPLTAALALGPAHAQWNVGSYDPAYALQKIRLDFCGRSPTFEEMQAMRASADPMHSLHDTLDSCLDSEFWRGKDGRLWNLANRKIQPLASIKAGDNAGDVPLGDYEDDYNLFVYVMSDERSARDLLSADYLVERDDGPPTTYTRVQRSPLEDVQARSFQQAQLVVPERRVGMLTTRWFLISNTMFTAIPRTTAAQAYRAYLGYDISKLEGLMPVEGEPHDFDAKGVDASECAVCHSTLDPLTYPFTRYEGLGGGDSMGPIGGLPGSYNSDRLERFTRTDSPTVVDTPESGVVLGVPVADLREWGRVAADSEAFARKITLDFWQMLLREAPRESERNEFDALWQGLMTEHDYQVEAMLHDLIETEAYGAP